MCWVRCCDCDYRVVGVLVVGGCWEAGRLATVKGVGCWVLGVGVFVKSFWAWRGVAWYGWGRGCGFYGGSYVEGDDE